MDENIVRTYDVNNKMRSPIYEVTSGFPGENILRMNMMKMDSIITENLHILWLICKRVWAINPCRINGDWQNILLMAPGVIR